MSCGSDRNVTTLNTVAGSRKMTWPGPLRTASMSPPSPPALDFHIRPIFPPKVSLCLLPRPHEAAKGARAWNRVGASQKYQDLLGKKRSTRCPRLVCDGGLKGNIIDGGRHGLEGKMAMAMNVFGSGRLIPNSQGVLIRTASHAATTTQPTHDTHTPLLNQQSAVAP